jgi:hypothetical protein
MQHIGIVIKTRSKVGLGCKIVSFLEGIHKNIDERIDHEHSQKQDCREQIEPALDAVKLDFFHRFFASNILQETLQFFVVMQPCGK